MMFNVQTISYDNESWVDCAYVPEYECQQNYSQRRNKWENHIQNGDITSGFNVSSVEEAASAKLVWVCKTIGHQREVSSQKIVERSQSKVR